MVNKDLKLILIEVDHKDTINGLSRRKDNGKMMLAPITVEDHEQAQYLLPIIISQTEPVKPGHWYYDPNSSHPIRHCLEGMEVPVGGRFKKILVRPEAFTKDEIFAIVSNYTWLLSQCE